MNSKSHLLALLITMISHQRFDKKKRNALLLCMPIINNLIQWVTRVHAATFVMDGIKDLGGRKPFVFPVYLPPPLMQGAGVK